MYSEGLGVSGISDRFLVARGGIEGKLVSFVNTEEVFGSRTVGSGGIAGELALFGDVEVLGSKAVFGSDGRGSTMKVHKFN